MINDKEKKMIQRYCIYPKIAVVALIFSFVQCNSTIRDDR